jgi:hypothetical protein
MRDEEGEFHRLSGGDRGDVEEDDVPQPQFAGQSCWRGFERSGDLDHFGSAIPG